MTTPAYEAADEFFRKVFPGDDSDPQSTGPDPAPVRRPRPAVDERRQRLLEPMGDPDRESW